MPKKTHLAGDQHDGYELAILKVAKQLNIRIIILDPVEFNYTIYDWIKSKFVIKDLSNLFYTLNTLINDKKILKEIKLAHKSQKNSVSPFDGKC